jgi:hypothetical protein
MSQASPIAYVDTEGGTAHASRHNSEAAAMLSGHSGTSRPSYAVAGTRWINTSATPWVVYKYDGADDIPQGTVNASTNEFIPYAGSVHGSTQWAAQAGPLVQDSTAIFTWTGSSLLWTGHLYAKFGGDGTHWATDGYYTIDCPTSGTVTAAGGSTDKTATAAGIPLAADEALYYIPSINAANTFVQANLRVVKLGGDYVVGPHWIFIAGVDGLGGVILGTGGYLPLWNTPTYLNSWSAAALLLNKGYCKDRNGFVHIQVGVTGGTVTDGTSLFVLPAYFRPTQSARISVDASSADGTRSPYLSIANDGTATFQGLSGAPTVSIIGSFLASL